MSSTQAIASYVERREDSPASDRTVESHKRVLKSFSEFAESRGRSITEASEEDCRAWFNGPLGEHSEATAATYISHLSTFYKRECDQNPAASIAEHAFATRSEIFSTKPRDMSIEDMRGFIQTVTHPLDRAVIVTLAKTGVRIGELCNLDMGDIEETENGESLRVSSSVKVGEKVRGEERTAANKRQNESVIPIDDELHSVLKKWLYIRPDPDSPADPLFLSTRDEWGTRLRPTMARASVKKHAERSGLHSANKPELNITPQYFRHFFSTWMLDRIGNRGIVSYLRGDKIHEGMGVYIHNWQNRAQEAYRENIYSLL